MAKKRRYEIDVERKLSVRFMTEGGSAGCPFKKKMNNK